MEYYDIELEYNYFLAESKLYDNLISLGSKIKYESYDISIINEDFKNTIKEYLEKVVKSIQSAWDRFLNMMVKSKYSGYIERIKKDVLNLDKDPGNKVTNLRVYDNTKLNNIKLTPFNREDLDKYETKKDYLKAHFSIFYKDDSKSLKQNMVDYIESIKEEEIIITKDMIDNAYKFCSTDFKNLMDNLKKELEQFNTNTKVISSQADTVVSAEETPEASSAEENNGNEVKGESASILLGIYESYLLEKDEDSSKAMKVDKATNPNDNDAFMKRLSYYIGGNVDVISAKMKILRDEYMTNIKLLTSVFPLINQAENKKEEKTSTNNNTDNNNNSSNIIINVDGSDNK